MSKMAIVEPRLQWFVSRMRRKLRLKKNQAKTDWRELGPLENLGAIKSEYAELCQTIGLWPGDKEMAIDECADIANRAMMMADQIHTRKLPDPHR